MGRKGKLEISMVSGRIYTFLKERPDSQAKMVVCQRYLEKLFKSKDSVKKRVQSTADQYSGISSP